MRQPLWLVIWIVAIEAIIVMVLIPGDWTQKVMERESVLLEQSLGSKEHQLIHDKATRWFNAALIDSGYYQAALNYIVPTKEQKLRSNGMENMGSTWFHWAERSSTSDG